MLAREVLEKISVCDPVYGKWVVNEGEECKVWCDSSNLAMGVRLEIDGDIVEDAAWLRKEDDGSHINVAELEAVLKGVNLALKWGRRRLNVVTDSACVYGWLRSILEDIKRPRVSGISEMIIRRRLSTIAQLIDEYDLCMTAELVPSAKNLADEMTRVPKKWLECKEPYVMMGVVENIMERVTELHNQHHLGVDRTMYLVEQQLGIPVNRRVVEKVVERCHRCRCIDPPPVRWEHGTLEVTSVWERVAADITHVSQVPYLTVIDCGPSRFVIWRKLRNETADSVCKELNNIFRERGSPCEFLSDNGPCFRSEVTTRFLKSWGVKQIFSCAYRPSGNGIVERNHRTIKRMVARAAKPVEDMVFWYNHSPNAKGLVPAEQIYSYRTKLPSKYHEQGSCEEVTDNSKYSVGDLVYVKPVNARCDSEWQLGKVTKVVSDVVIQVNGINRHVGDLRLAEKYNETGDACEESRSEGVEIVSSDVEVSDGNEEHDGSNADGESDDETIEARVVRDRRPPRWLVDYYVDG